MCNSSKEHSVTRDKDKKGWCGWEGVYEEKVIENKVKEVEPEGPYLLMQK